MAELLLGEDPEPCEPGPAGRLFVPVRPGPAGRVARLFRTPVGGRTAVAFTTPHRLGAVLGAREPWIGLAEPALRALIEPLGVTGITVDPALVAHPVGPRPVRVSAEGYEGTRRGQAAAPAPAAPVQWVG